VVAPACSSRPMPSFCSTSNAAAAVSCLPAPPVLPLCRARCRC
jgi:hypothetical protein